MRTVALAIVLGVVSAVAAPVVATSQEIAVRDLGPSLGLRQHESSYAVSIADLDADGFDDFLIVHHGSRPSELFVTDHDGGTPTGVHVATRLVDTVHERPDRHGCVLGDVNLDGLTDIFCTKGAQQGVAKKWNELWLQGPEGTWSDEAAAYGVEDVWGRGRYPAWIDLNGDDYLDLFVGNDIPRRDEHTTENRTFVNEAGERFREVDLGISLEQGANCVQVLDADGDGRDDLLLCGRFETFLYLRRGDRFVRGNDDLGVPTEQALGAHLEDLNGDDLLDLVMVSPTALRILLAGEDGRIGETAHAQPLGHGHGLAVGDVDGDGTPDVYAVDGCVDRTDRPDVLLLNGGDARRWTRVDVPPPGDGCGDVAATFDWDRDGADEVLVLNGGGTSQPLDLDGPDQLLTLGDWELSPP
ncbi:MAG TPA: VCBS repeat-containing protein [Actinomycetota bacterium]|nr:VCBS repeat-containing protein [Actinomycetota bacterium]